MYRLNQEQEALVGGVRKLADEQIRPHAVRVDQDGVFPKEAMQALGESGFLGLTVGDGRGMDVILGVVLPVFQLGIASSSAGVAELEAG